MASTKKPNAIRRPLKLASEVLGMLSPAIDIILSIDAFRLLSGRKNPMNSIAIRI